MMTVTFFSSRASNIKHKVINSKCVITSKILSICTHQFIKWSLIFLRGILCVS